MTEDEDEDDQLEIVFTGVERVFAKCLVDLHRLVPS